MKKRFLLDTNVLMRSPNSIYVFEDNDVYVCSSTLEELDNLKTAPGETGYNAREAIRALNNLREKNMIGKSPLPEGGMFHIVQDFAGSMPEEVMSKLPFGWTEGKPDNRIIATALKLGCILVTSDISMIIKAETAGVATEVFRHEQVSESTLKYLGRSTVYATRDVIDAFYANRSMLISDLYEPENVSLNINEFVIVTDCINPKNTALGYFNGSTIQMLRYDNTGPMDIRPKNAGQRFAMEALLAPANEIPLTILRGPAGVAKTFLALACGLEKVMNQNEYRKMLILRPNIKFDDDIGFLKGDEMDKIRPLIRPCIDNLEVLLSTHKDSGEMAQSKIDEIFERGYISAEALAYLRGRSISNSYILVDEAQNASPQQMLGIISRAGLGSKIVIVGDPDQIDNPKLDKKNNGLVYAAEKMLNSKLCMQLVFDSEECVRSPLAQEASRLLK